MTGTQEWQALDARHHLHPFTNHGELAQKGSRIIVKGEGCYLIDSEGRRIIDGMAGLWCVNLGYSEHRLVEAATRQMAVLPYYNTFFQCATPPAIKLAAAIAEVTPAGLDRIFFTNSGSEANDTAIKLVWFYWNLMGQPEKKIMISREFGYHGVTLAAASLSGQWPMHPQHDLPLARFTHVGAPYWYGQGGELSPEAFALQAAGELEAKILALGPERVGEALVGSGQEWFHGYTYSGHPVAAAVALATIRVLRDDRLIERANGPISRHFADALASLADHPLVGETRSCGLIGAVELVEDQAARRHFAPARKVGLMCRDHCIEQGLVMRAIRDIMVLSPPLIITEAEIDEIVTKARAAFDLTLRDLG